MENNTPINQDVIIASSDKEKSKLITRLKKEGAIRKIAPRIYTANKIDSPEKIIRRNLYFILGELYPGALVSHRSAMEYAPTESGHFYVTYNYTKKLQLPGLTLHFIEGKPPLPDDKPFMQGLCVSSQARAYLENLQSAHIRDNETKCLPREALEKKLDMLLQTNGEAALNGLRDQARVIAPQLGMEKEAKKLDLMIGAILTTKPSNVLVSQVALARAFGEPFDSHRIELFDTLMTKLMQFDFADLPEPNQTEKAYDNFAFFESYFSNYIEGTEFEIDEAHHIVETQRPMATRNADSHDILGTYNIVSNRNEMSFLPATADHLFQLLLHRHAIMMAFRPGAEPGVFKTKNNRAGDTHFVDYTLVRGTLKKGFEFYNALQHPFARAVFMLFMISEVHPFIDGNGRVSRIMMNAELSAAGQSKIIIPTVFRIDYIDTLRLLSRQGNPDKFIKAMLRVREFSYHLQGDDFETMRRYLEQCNAFKDGDENILRF
ncbi:MAG: Fic family protein [Bacteroidales bacterium]|nr:Fic family protein [Bacteroidales bacterium]